MVHYLEVIFLEEELKMLAQMKFILRKKRAERKMII